MTVVFSMLLAWAGQTWSQEPLAAQERELPIQLQGDATSMAFDHSGKLLGVGYKDGSLAVHRTDTGELLWSARGEKAPVKDLMFDADSKHLAVVGEHSADSRGQVTIRLVRDGKPVLQRPIGEELSSGLASAKRKSVFGVSDVSDLVFFDLSASPPEIKSAHRERMQNCIAFSRQDDLVVTGGEGGLVRLQEWPSLKPRHDLTTDPNTICCHASFSADDRQYAVVSLGWMNAKGKAHVIETATGKTVVQRDLDPGEIGYVFFAARDEPFAVLRKSAGGGFRLLNIRTGACWPIDVPHDAQFLEATTQRIHLYGWKGRRALVWTVEPPASPQPARTPKAEPRSSQDEKP